MSRLFLLGASLVAQWLRICLPMQGTWVRALVWEDSTCRGATGPVSHNYWACASGACALQQERPHSERPTHCNEEWPPLATTRESPHTEMKTQHSHKKKKDCFCCITKWISYIYTYIPISPPSCTSLPPSLSHPSRWTQSTKLISLCYVAASH